jgi:regulatory protein
MDEDLLLEKAMQRAYRLLARRARSAKELRAGLKGKGFGEPILSKVTAKLAGLHYLDDESFALQWARNLAVNKLYGNRRIELSLREKGIPEALIEKALDEARQEISEPEAAKKLIKKKTENSESAPMDMKEKRRLYQRLLGKGFTQDVIAELLRGI